MSAEQNTPEGGVVAFNYTIIEDGLAKLRGYRTTLGEYRDALTELKTVDPDVWFGKDHDAFEQVMTDAENGCAMTDDNIFKIDNWLNGTEEASQTNESVNTGIIIDAYQTGSAGIPG